MVYNKCPTVTATATYDICGQHNGTITATGHKGTLPYQFSIDGTTFQSANFFSGLTAGNYTVTIKDALGFTSTTAVIIANWCLTVTGIPANAECGNANGTITATGAGGLTPYTYSIDGINFQSANLFTGLLAGNYTLTVQDATGGMVSALITIANLPGPSMTVSTQPANCDSSGGGLSIQATGGTPPYQYSIDGTNYQFGNNFALIQGSYTTWVQDAIGCTATLPATIPLTNDLTLNLEGQLSICQGSSMTWSGSSNATEFSWSPTTGLNNPNILLPTASPAQTTAYTVTATRGACQTQASWTLTVNPTPIASAGQDTTICYGQSVQLNGSASANGGTSANGGSGTFTYSWSPTTDLNNSTIAGPVVESPDHTVTYTLSVTDLNGCTSLDRAIVTINVTPPAKLSAGDDTTALTGEPIQLNAIDVNNSDFTSYAWTPATGLSNPDIANPVATLDASTTYSITATTPAGCEGTASLTVKVYMTIGLIVPSAFTPNGDGRNDLLKVIPLGIRQLQYFAVFNRWGQRIFYTTDAGKGWDGTVNGQPQPGGAYIWMAAAIDVKGRSIERNGSIILIR